MSILTDKKVMMDQADMTLIVKVVKALWEKDLDGLNADEGWEVCLRLDKAFGIPLIQGYKDRPVSHDEPMPEKWRVFLEKLCTPYGKTILKVYQAKRGLTKCQF